MAEEKQISADPALVAEVSRLIDRQQRWINHPVYVAYRKKRDEEWRAKPWWERARIRASAWTHQRRVRLGEIIAGRSFDD
jgi:hypothetical protein